MSCIVRFVPVGTCDNDICEIGGGWIIRLVHERELRKDWYWGRSGVNDLYFCSLVLFEAKGIVGTLLILINN